LEALSSADLDRAAPQSRRHYNRRQAAICAKGQQNLQMESSGDNITIHFRAPLETNHVVRNRCHRKYMVDFRMLPNSTPRSSIAIQRLGACSN
jgi:hypothetical protein